MEQRAAQCDHIIRPQQHIQFALQDKGNTISYGVKENTAVLIKTDLWVLFLAERLNYFVGLFKN